ncbi:hypothetical protein CARUB_v10012683mg [Capsella rubella]|uniref:Pentapeptide repeat-containing protein n=1 Tax=Capsella rubella TaxID=81985 RepID=R0GPC1_9BRAS|nr:hypothetical protein CARUB_v10012683mg [Capsella rubella]
MAGADLSDTLMDRMVLNEANLTNAVLVRSVLTRSDLGGAKIEGADFSDAVIDLLQKQEWTRGRVLAAEIAGEMHMARLLLLFSVHHLNVYSAVMDSAMKRPDSVMSSSFSML